VNGVDPPHLELGRYFALCQAPVDQVGHRSGQDLHSLLQHGRQDVVYPERFRVVEAPYRLRCLLRVRKLEKEFWDVDVTSGRDVVVGGSLPDVLDLLPDVVDLLRDVADLLRDLSGILPDVGHLPGDVGRPLRDFGSILPGSRE
jgi:hypothetical protein